MQSHVYASFTSQVILHISYLNNVHNLFSCKQKHFSSPDESYFNYKSAINPFISAVTQLITINLLLWSKPSFSLLASNRKSLMFFTLSVFIHSLLTVPSLIVHYMPPDVDPSYSPVPSHSTLFLRLASSQWWPRASWI